VRCERSDDFVDRARGDGYWSLIGGLIATVRCSACGKTDLAYTAPNEAVRLPAHERAS
jgi:hypothetical protein